MVVPLVAIALATAPGPAGEAGKPVVPLVSLSRPKPRPVPKKYKLATKLPLKLQTRPNLGRSTK